MSNPAGWYRDPSNANQARYWDGKDWTGQTHPFDPQGVSKPSQIPPTPPMAPQATKTPEKPKATAKQTAIGCGVFLVLALIFGGVMSSCMANAGKQDTTNLGDGGHAKIACRGMVQDKLKAPSTADFSNESVSGSGTSWTVSGSVDAQNSFGAKIRSSYTCSITFSPSDDQWSGPVSVG